MKKILLFLILGIFLINLVSASSIFIDFDLMEQEQNTCFNIPAICDNCTYMDITILYSDGTPLIEDQSMQNVSSSYYYNYTFCDTDTLGTYMIINHYEEDGAYPYTDTNFFKVTPTGYAQTIPQSINSLGYLILMIFLTIIIGILGFSLKDSEKLWVLGIFFIFLSILLLVYDFWIGYEFHKNLTGINNGSSIQEILFVAFLVLICIGLFISAVLLIKNWKKIFKWLKEIKKEAKREEQEKEESINLLD